jgi:DNA-binding transcriptional regulator GbsR (MarR family)
MRQEDEVGQVTGMPDRDRVGGFVERFAEALVAAGMQRMASRVFAAVLSSETGRLTAAQLADLLVASPAAISGAVRYLEQVDMIRRSREPGSRRDYFTVGDDVWYEAFAHKDQMLQLWEKTMRDGAQTLGEDSEAGRRMAETAAFFAFLREELPPIMDRWAVRRDKLRATWT